MNLDDYLSEPGRSNAALAAAVRVSPVLISQWRTGVRSVPVERCVAIEQATCSSVTRIDLRPNDWWQIWPELAELHPGRVPDRPGADEPEPERSGPSPTQSGPGHSGVTSAEKVPACDA